MQIVIWKSISLSLAENSHIKAKNDVLYKSSSVKNFTLSSVKDFTLSFAKIINRIKMILILNCDIIKKHSANNKIFKRNYKKEFLFFYTKISCIDFNINFNIKQIFNIIYRIFHLNRFCENCNQNIKQIFELLSHFWKIKSMFTKKIKLMYKFMIKCQTWLWRKNNEICKWNVDITITRWIHYNSK